MDDDLIRSVEGFLRLRKEPFGDNQCVGCGKALDGVPHMEIHVINAWGADAGATCRVCSWGCMREIAAAIGKRDCP